MTTNNAVVRYPIRSLIGESLHGQVGRSRPQAGARRAVDMFSMERSAAYFEIASLYTFSVPVLSDLVA